jgi:ABC-2 type transport system ATP-binding protein
MDLAVRVAGLGKDYQRRKRGDGFWGGLRSYFAFEGETVSAVRDLSFSIERGESVGLIGENGAGKSTTVKMLTGILVPSRGLAETLGFNPWKERRKLALNIGVVFGQKPQLLWDIPAGESFKLLKAMYRIPDEIYRFTFHETVERLEIERLLKTPVRLLSLGERMRCDLAASLLHAPAVAFLDEPTIGMDVLVKERVRELLIQMRQRFGMTMVLTTHDLKDISTTCERLIVLDQGALLYDGDLAGFQRQFAGERSVLVELAQDPHPLRQAELERELEGLSARPHWEAPRRLRVVCKRAGTLPLVTSRVLHYLEVEDLSLHGTEIETIVAELYRDGGRQAREAAEP